MRLHQGLPRRFIQLAALGVLASVPALPVRAPAAPPKAMEAPATEPIHGMMGVGTWNTQAEFKDIRVMRGSQVLARPDFAGGLQGWKTPRGQWSVVDGALRQTGGERGTRALFGDPSWSNYTLSLKARKLSGEEGFLIFFGMPDENTRSWWSVGGWGNTQHGIEAPGVVTQQVPGKIETGRWYDIRVELRGNMARAFLDNQLIQTVAQAPARRNFGHPLIPDLIADPSIAEFDGTFYLYGTTDIDAGLAASGQPVVWKSKDFLHWSFVGSIFPRTFDAMYWAPSAPVHKDGRYYLFPTLDQRIAAVVADSPEGPFRTLDGKDVSRKIGWQPFPITAGKPIDADLLRDDDGSHYMVWSQRYIGKLKPDFSGFDGEPVPIQTGHGGYSEGPALFKRNGICYYLYTLGGHESYQYAYMMSRTSPLGPWEAPPQDIIATTDQVQGIYGPGHGCFFNPRGSEQWYFVHLEYGRSGSTRQVWATKMNFNADGTIQPIRLSLEGVGALRSDPAYIAPNLALGARATASSTRPDFQVPPVDEPSLNRVEGYAPTNALDGSNGSRWLPRQDDKAAWFQLDLNQVRDIQRTEVCFVAPTAGHAYRLDYSLDGKTWQQYGGHEEVVVQSPHTDAKAVRTRYLKLTILKGTPGLWEFRVY